MSETNPKKSGIKTDDGKPKKVGITVDNYKVKKFYKELTKAGFEAFKRSPLTEDTAIITFWIDGSQEQTKALEKVCILVELHFKQGN